jgi:hypothetical protein
MEIKYGERSRVVRLVQGRLKSIGFTLLEVDGVYGPETQKVVDTVYRRQGLPPVRFISDEFLAGIGIGVDESTPESNTKAGLVNLVVPHFCQSADWGIKYLGMSRRLKFSSQGCAVTTCAMLLKYFGVDHDPRSLHAVWKKDELFARSARGDKVLVDWTAVSTVAAQQGVYLSWAHSPASTREEFDKVIVGNINKGIPVIAAVDWKKDNDYDHFLLITGYVSGQYLLCDPAFTDGSYRDNTANVIGPGARRAYRIRRLTVYTPRSYQV